MSTLANMFLNKSGKLEKNIEKRKNETNLAKKRTVRLSSFKEKDTKLARYIFGQTSSKEILVFCQ